MMARSTTRSNQRPDTLMQDRKAPDRQTSCDARPDHTSGQTRPRRPPPWRAYARPVLLSKRTHFGPVGSGQAWANNRHHRTVIWDRHSMSVFDIDAIDVSTLPHSATFDCTAIVS